MSQQYKSVHLRKSLNKQTTITTKGTSVETNRTTASDLISFLFKTIFESVTEEIHSPVKVEGDSLRIDEDRLVENRSYPIFYKGKEYFIRRKKDKTQIFQLKD